MLVSIFSFVALCSILWDNSYRGEDMSKISEHTIAPSAKDRELAAESVRALETLSALNHELRVEVLDEGVPMAQLSLPAPAVRMLSDILSEMAKGNSVTLIPTDTMLSTQEAADMLSVSRPFLVNLLETGRIPYQRLGSHRRIRFQDLMAFKAAAGISREEALRLLTEEAQEMRLGY
jgi:excisionase family DNA binding protein